MLFNLRLAPSELEAAKASALAAIDAAAEATRSQWITHGAGQALVYLAKSAEAARFLAMYPTSASMVTDSSVTTWPFLSSELNITATTLFDVAIVINTNATAWNEAASKIERTRLASKAAIKAAKTQGHITAASAVVWPVNS